MKTYVINLKEAEDRKKSMIVKLEHQKIDDYYFVEGINGKTQPVAQFYDAQSFSRLYRRQATPGEVGCAISHLKVHQEIIKNDEPAMVFEDDVVFLCENNELSNVQLDFDFDVIFLNGPRWQKKPATFKGKPTDYDINGIKLEEIIIPLHEPYYWWLGSSYILSPSGAKKIEKANWPIKHPADAWFFFGMEKAYQLERYIVQQDKSWGSLTGNR